MEQLYKYRSLIQKIPTIRKDLTELQSLWSIPDSEMRQIRLIIEEIFSNVIRYAFSDSQEHLVHVQLKKVDNEITIQITDDGIPFNPLDEQWDKQMLYIAKQFTSLLWLTNLS